MNRIILVVVLVVFVQPLPVAGETTSVVEKLMKDSTTTNLGKSSSGKKSSSEKKSSPLSPGLEDIKKDIEGRAEANRALREHLASQREDSRIKSKRQAKAKRQRWRDRQKKYQQPEPQR